MQTHRLIPHPGHPPLAVRGIEAGIIGHDDAWLRLRWRIEGTKKLVVPAFAGAERADGLWRTTCFEAFIRPEGGTAYVEFNLSPSRRWAAYDFSAYREAMARRPFPRVPESAMRPGSGQALFDAALPAGGLPSLPAALGLAAVIEEEGGVLSYWALAHPAERPDFHHPACLAARLAAPGGG